MDSRIKEVVSKQREITILKGQQLNYGKAVCIQQLERQISTILAKCKPHIV